MGRYIGYYITGNMEEGLGDIYIINTEKENPEKIQDLYCTSNNNNFNKENGEFLLIRTIINMRDTIERDRTSQTYIDGDTNEVKAIFKSGNYETFQYAEDSGWRADSSFSDSEENDDLPNCAITGYGKTEMDAILDCMKNRDFIKKLGDEYYEKHLHDMVNKEELDNLSKEVEENNESV